jgi:signal transduction histidine kinase/DNA-binding response OmpR family regulator
MTVQLVCTIVAMALLWRLSEHEITESMSGAFLTHGHTVAESIAKSVELSLANRDVTSVQSALDASLKTPAVDWAYVTSADGRVLADTFVPLFPDYLPRFESTTGHATIQPPGRTRPVVVFTEPVMEGILGAVHIGMNQDELFASMARVRLLLLTAVGVVFSFLTIILGLVTRRIMAPVRALTSASSVMADNLNGDFQSLPVQGANEIGILTASFNRMMLERQQDRKHLEARVRERTQDLVRTNEQLESAKQLAEAATRAKSDFLSTMSHEIRTPMNGVLGMTNLLLETGLSNEQMDYALTVRSSGEALLAIINDILDFSKMEAGKMTIEPICFDLGVAVEEVVELLGTRAAEKNLDLILGYAQNAPRRIVGDPGRIRQILINLIANAIKFTHCGHVLVRIACEDPETSPARFTFSVEDTGIGIAEDKLPSLFDKFTQADTSTTRTYGGTGLGLSISKRLVELMDGQLTAASVLGEGSQFSFQLPLPLDSGDPAALPYRTISLDGARVLVVDDNALNLRIVAEQLASTGAEVTCASSGAAACSILRDAHEAQRPFHIAVLDYLMPEMDGEMLAKSLKSDGRFSALLLVMLSSSAQKSDGARFRSVGFSAYLVKPCRAAVLREALTTLWSALSDGRTVPEIVTRHTLAEARIQYGGKKVPQGTHRSQWTPSRVLLAEDNPVNQKLAQRLLEKAGCQVDVVANGLEAVRLWEECLFDIILMDCQMPEMDGYEATREIRFREIRRGQVRTPIVAITANTMLGDREKCLDAGMDDFISKPIPDGAIGRVLQRWVRSTEQQEDYPALKSA